MARPSESRADHERRIPVREHMAGRAAEVVQGERQPRQRRGPSAVQREPHRWAAAVAEDGHQGEQLLRLAIHRPHANVCPVGLRLLAGVRLEADLRLAHHRRPEQAQLALERRVAAGEPVLSANSWRRSVPRMAAQPARRRSTWASCAAVSSVGLARTYCAGPSRCNSRRTVSRHTPNSRASALTVHPWRCRAFISIHVSPDCNRVPPRLRR